MPTDRKAIAKAVLGAASDLAQPGRDFAGRFAISLELDSKTFRQVRGLARESDATVSEVVGAALRLVLSSPFLVRRLRRTLPPAGGQKPRHSRSGRKPERNQ